MAKYILQYFIEWRSGCLWPMNEASRNDFGAGPYDEEDPCPLPLSSDTLIRCRDLVSWHDESLNWDYPPDPGPWRQTECDRFNAASTKLLNAIKDELGEDFEVADDRDLAKEDPDLDAYLEDPKGFQRKSKAFD